VRLALSTDARQAGLYWPRENRAASALTVANHLHENGSGSYLTLQKKVNVPLQPCPSSASINVLANTALQINASATNASSPMSVYWKALSHVIHISDAVKVKVKVHALDIAPLRSETSAQKRSGMACVLKGSHSFTCTPTRSSAIGMRHTCLCLPSYNWYSFTDPGGMEG